MSDEPNPVLELSEIVRAYRIAKDTVINSGYSYEIDWQSDVSFESLTEAFFLQEAAWVILSAGMREAIIRGKFEHISAAFFDWESAAIISIRSDECRDAALKRFNHRPKIDAIIALANYVYSHGFKSVRERLEIDGVEYISQFRYLGPATSLHLAKNIGLQVAKPDRHLIRIATAVGYSDPNHLCREIGEFVGEKVAVVDLVLWRYATLARDYLTLFRRSSD
jgi:hypothetical protein